MCCTIFRQDSPDASEDLTEVRIIIHRSFEARQHSLWTSSGQRSKEMATRLWQLSKISLIFIKWPHSRMMIHLWACQNRIRCWWQLQYLQLRPHVLHFLRHFLQHHHQLMDLFKLKTRAHIWTKSTKRSSCMNWLWAAPSFVSYAKMIERFDWCHSFALQPHNHFSTRLSLLCLLLFS